MQLLPSSSAPGCGILKGNISAHVYQTHTCSVHALLSFFYILSAVIIFPQPRSFHHLPDRIFPLYTSSRRSSYPPECTFMEPAESTASRLGWFPRVGSIIGQLLSVKPLRSQRVPSRLCKANMAQPLGRSVTNIVESEPNLPWKDRKVAPLHVRWLKVVSSSAARRRRHDSASRGAASVWWNHTPAVRPACSIQPAN